MKKKKIKVLYLLASDRFSGAENVVCTIINNVSSKFEGSYCSVDGEIRKQLSERKIKFFPLKRMNYFEVKKVVDKYKPDIIHAHDYRASFVAAMFFRRCKIISHIHVNNPIMNKKNIKSFLFKVLCKRYERVLWVSDSAFDNYVYKDSVLDKSEKLLNVIDSSYIVNKSNSYNYSKEYDLIYLGRLSFQKNPERLLELCCSLKKVMPNFTLAMVGTGEMEGVVKDLICKYDLVDNIDFLGFRDNPYPILKKSKILIMTSIYEGTPMAALEAQALSKPIISTPVDGLKNIIKNDYNGYLSDDNEVLVNKIVEYLDKNTYDRISSNVVKNFKNINDEKRYYSKLINLYNRILKDR